MQLVSRNQTVEDSWQTVAGDAPLPTNGDIIVPVSRWLADRRRLLTHNGRVGVTISGDDDLAAIVGDLEHLALIALNFQSFTDGRNYSNARLLRDRYAYKGELRATGEVRRDQLFYLTRCGIDSFLLAHDCDVDQFLLGFGDFSCVYQTASDNRIPVYRLRAGTVCE